ncbi:sulfite oxidase [Evansella cellulosilytica]|nr:sulfite oxidase [Evansella cellulosilytica]
MEKLHKLSLNTRNLYPENKESPIHFLHDTNTPTHLKFIRNHFSYPYPPETNISIFISGHVQKSILFTLADICKYPIRTVHCVLECAGNKRSFFRPKVYGEQWENGAISQGKWSGVSLRDLLLCTGINRNANEVVFKGRDKGVKKKRVVHFERSLPIKKALHKDTIVAFKYNGKPISYKAGGPIRLIVPQWYGMASVKWLSEITVIKNKFNGQFQSEDYMYYPLPPNHANVKPVTSINVNSIIQSPINYATLSSSKHLIKGIAWTGEGVVKSVRVSVDEGQTWQTAYLNKSTNTESYTWVQWSLLWHFKRKGHYVILVQAEDSYGRFQPESALWNRKGYGYNEITKAFINIE